MALKAIIAPSILSADFANLAEETRKVISYGAQWIHVDIMDGHFVPNLTIGAPVVKSLRKSIPDIFFDCHLMVSEPQRWIKDFKDAGASGYTVHIEAINPDQVEETLISIRDAGLRVGVAVKPKTEVDSLKPLIRKGLIDMVLVMTVEPGFAAQKFMSDVLYKVKDLRAEFPTLDIEVDGGLAPCTIDEAGAAGANVIVAGSAIFNAPDPKVAFQSLETSLKTFL